MSHYEITAPFYSNYVCFKHMLVRKNKYVCLLISVE